MHSIGLTKLWIAFVKGKDFRWIPAHDIAAALGPKALALPFFHAFSGCDTASSFLVKGKKSAWQTWSVFDKVTATFTKLSSTPESVCCEDLQILEEYVVLLYDRSSSCTGVSEAWRHGVSEAVAKSCQELTRCSCKVHCSGRCRCFKAGLFCTALCECRALSFDAI